MSSASSWRTSIVDEPASSWRTSIVDEPASSWRSSIVDAPSSSWRTSIVDEPEEEVLRRAYAPYTDPDYEREQAERRAAMTPAEVHADMELGERLGSAFGGGVETIKKSFLGLRAKGKHAVYDELRRIDEAATREDKLRLARRKDRGGRFSLLAQYYAKVLAQGDAEAAQRIKAQALEEKIAALADLSKVTEEMSKRPYDDGMAQGLARAKAAEDAGGGWAETAGILYDLFAEDPERILSLVASSTPFMLATLAAAPAGPLGMGAVAGVLDGSMEFVESLDEQMREGGLDPDAKGDWDKAFGDPAMMEKAQKSAVRRGVAVGVAAGISGALAAKFVPGVPGVAAQLGGGGAIDMAGEKAAGGSQADVLLEGLLGAGMQLPEAAALAAAGKGAARRPAPPTMNEPRPPDAALAADPLAHLRQPRPPDAVVVPEPEQSPEAKRARRLAELEAARKAAEAAVSGGVAVADGTRQADLAREQDAIAEDVADPEKTLRESIGAAADTADTRLAQPPRQRSKTDEETEPRTDERTAAQSAGVAGQAAADAGAGGLAGRPEAVGATDAAEPGAGTPGQVRALRAGAAGVPEAAHRYATGGQSAGGAGAAEGSQRAAAGGSAGAAAAVVGLPARGGAPAGDGARAGPVAGTGAGAGTAATGQDRPGAAHEPLSGAAAQKESAARGDELAARPGPSAAALKPGWRPTHFDPDTNRPLQQALDKNGKATGRWTDSDGNRRRAKKSILRELPDWQVEQFATEADATEAAGAGKRPERRPAAWESALRSSPSRSTRSANVAESDEKFAREMLDLVGLEGQRVAVVAMEDLKDGDLPAETERALREIADERAAEGRAPVTGAAVPLETPGDWVILVDPRSRGGDPQAQAEVLAHEVGHVVWRALSNDLRENHPAAYRAVIDEWSGWVRSMRGKGVAGADVVRAARPPFDSEGASAGMDGSGRAFLNTAGGAYLTSFDEWTAEGVRKWSRASHAPRTVVEKYFSDVLKKLKAVYAKLVGTPADQIPPKALARLLDDLVEAARDRRERPRELRAAQRVARARHAYWNAKPNQEKHSLLEVIALLGGVKKTPEIRAEFDGPDLRAQAGGIHLVFRDDGMDLDTLAETLRADWGFPQMNGPGDVLDALHNDLKTRADGDGHLTWPHGSLEQVRQAEQALEELEDARVLEEIRTAKRKHGIGGGADVWSFDTDDIEGTDAEARIAVAAKALNYDDATLTDLLGEAAAAGMSRAEMAEELEGLIAHDREIAEQVEGPSFMRKAGSGKGKPRAEAKARSEGRAEGAAAEREKFRAKAAAARDKAAADKAAAEKKRVREALAKKTLLHGRAQAERAPGAEKARELLADQAAGAGREAAARMPKPEAGQRVGASKIAGDALTPGEKRGATRGWKPDEMDPQRAMDAVEQGLKSRAQGDVKAAADSLERLEPWLRDNKDRKDIRAAVKALKGKLRSWQGKGRKPADAYVKKALAEVRRLTDGHAEDMALRRAVKAVTDYGLAPGHAQDVVVREWRRRERNEPGSMNFPDRETPRAERGPPARPPKEFVGEIAEDTAARAGDHLTADGELFASASGARDSLVKQARRTGGTKRGKDDSWVPVRVPGGIPSSGAVMARDGFLMRPRKRDLWDEEAMRTDLMIKTGMSGSKAKPIAKRLMRGKRRDEPFPEWFRRMEQGLEDLPDVAGISTPPKTPADKIVQRTWRYLTDRQYREELGEAVGGWVERANVAGLQLFATNPLAGLQDRPAFLAVRAQVLGKQNKLNQRANRLGNLLAKYGDAGIETRRAAGEKISKKQAQKIKAAKRRNVFAYLSARDAEFESRPLGEVVWRESSVAKTTRRAVSNEALAKSTNLDRLRNLGFDFETKKDLAQALDDNPDIKGTFDIGELDANGRGARLRVDWVGSKAFGNRVRDETKVSAAAAVRMAVDVARGDETAAQTAIGELDTALEGLREALDRRPVAAEADVKAVQAVQDDLEALSADVAAGMGGAAQREAANKVKSDLARIAKNSAETRKKGGYRDMVTAREAAREIKGTMIQDGLDLVRAGALSEASFEKHRGAYMVNLYLKHLQMGGFSVRGLTVRPSPMNYRHQRNLDMPGWQKELDGLVMDPSYVAQRSHAQQGADVAVLGAFQTIAQNPNWVRQDRLVKFNGLFVTSMWLRGRAKELRQRAADGLVGEKMPDNTQRRLGPAVADNMTAAAEMLERYAAVAENGYEAYDPKNWREMPDSPRYGALRGAVVHRAVHAQYVAAPALAEEMIELQGTDGAPVFTRGKKLMIKGVRKFKLLKVVGNFPPSWIRNFTSGNLQLFGSGMGPVDIVKYETKAFEELRKGYGEWSDLFERAGFKFSTFTLVELQHLDVDAMRLVSMQFSNPLALAKRIAEAGDKKGVGKAVVYAKTLARAGSKPVGVQVARFQNFASGNYQMIEVVQKAAKTMHEMERYGIDEQTAVQRAQDTIFDYGLVGEGVQAARNNPLMPPFITFFSKVLPQMARGMVAHPLHMPVALGIHAVLRLGRFTRLAAYVGGVLGAAGLLDDDDDRTGITEEVFRATMQSLRKWMQDNPNMILVVGEDNAQVINLGYTLPYGAHLEAALGALEVLGYKDGQMFNPDASPLAGLQKFIKATGLFGSPVLGVGYAIYTGEDAFTGREIVDPDVDEYGDVALKMAAWTFDFWAPGTLQGLPRAFSPDAPGMIPQAVRAVNGTLRADGRPNRSLSQAIAAFGGASITPVDAEVERERQAAGMDAQMSQQARLARRLDAMIPADTPPQKRKEMRQEIQKDYEKRLRIIYRRHGFSEEGDDLRMPLGGS